jgi:hypothetical protein
VRTPQTQLQKENERAQQQQEEAQLEPARALPQHHLHPTYSLGGSSSCLFLLFILNPKKENVTKKGDKIKIPQGAQKRNCFLYPRGRCCCDGGAA